MTLYKQITDRIKECMKNGGSKERDILRTLIGEVQSKSIKSGKTEVSDELIQKTVKSFKENAFQNTIEGIQKKVKIDSNSDEWKKRDEEAKIEIAIYNDLLPKYETVDVISVLLKPIMPQICTAKSDGQATGIAMGFLKKSDKSVQGQDVAQVVKKMRK